MTAGPDLSLEQQVALLSLEEQEAVLASMDVESLAYDWHWQGRPSQMLPVDTGTEEDDWTLALMNAGRGFGKTRAGAEWLREVDAKWDTLGRDPGEHLRVALVGRTASDVRDTILQGPSGLLNVYPPSLRDEVEWIPSQRRVNLPNGGVCLCFSAEEPDQLRGPAFHIGWADELAAYKQIKGQGELDAWTNLRIAVRLGALPQIIATTTPKRVPILRALIAEILDNPRMLIRKGRTSDNAYLSAAYKDTLVSLYGGTALGAQELDGEMLDDVAGATVSASDLDAYRLTGVPEMPRGTRWIKLVSVDPSVAERPNDECGIVVIYAPLTSPILKRHAYVVDDVSLRASPAVWADVVVQTARLHGATVIAETNQGGAMVQRLIKDAAAAADVPPPPFRSVWSTAAKAVRAEPVGAAYARGRVHHINVLGDLEDQLTTWTKADSGYSPDRLDAVVHGLASVLFPDAMQNGVPGSGVSHGQAGSGVRIERQVNLPRPRVSVGASAIRRASGLIVPGLASRRGNTSYGR